MAEDPSLAHALFVFNELRGPNDSLVVRIIPITSLWAGLFPMLIRSVPELNEKDSYGLLDEGLHWHFWKVLMVSSNKQELVEFLVHNSKLSVRNKLKLYLDAPQRCNGSALDGALYLTEAAVNELRLKE